MNADLMRPPRFWIYRENGRFASVRQPHAALHFVCRHGVFHHFRGVYAPPNRTGYDTDRTLYDPPLAPHRSPNYRKIGFRNITACEKGFQAIEHCLCLRNDHHARRFAIQPVHDAGAGRRVVPNSLHNRTVGEKPIDKRRLVPLLRTVACNMRTAFRAPAFRLSIRAPRPMNKKPRGLVHRKKVVIFIQYLWFCHGVGTEGIEPSASFFETAAREQ
ncbi:MAG: hypothetical protein RL681_138 [Candidatus Parcubacteria bacterium]